MGVQLLDTRAEVESLKTELDAAKQLKCELESAREVDARTGPAQMAR